MRHIKVVVQFKTLYGIVQINKQNYCKRERKIKEMQTLAAVFVRTKQVEEMNSSNSIQFFVLIFCCENTGTAVLNGSLLLK